MKLRCPKCGFGKSVPKKSLPDKPRVNALCPKCGERFSVELQELRNSTYFDFKGLFAKKNSVLAIIILLTVVALASFYLGQSSHTGQVVQLSTKPQAEAPSAPRPVEAREEAKKEVLEEAKVEPPVVTLQCSGEEKMIDFSPSTTESSEDRWEAGPWPFTDIYTLTLADNGLRVELFLDSRDEYAELACRETGEYCSDQYETSALEVKFNMELGLDKNLFARELRINRADGTFHQSVTMTGGSLRNIMTKTGTCKVIDTGATSF